MSVLLIPNPTKDTGLAVTRQAAAVLAGLGVPVLMPQPFANEFGSAGLTGVHFLPEADAYRAADQVVTIGGDGTLLRAGLSCMKHGKPVLGVNLGRTGFLATCEVGELTAKLRRLAAGEFTLASRRLLHAEAPAHGWQADAINDLVVFGQTRLHPMDYKVYCDGALVGSYRSDGMILATPTGSTAYQNMVTKHVKPRRQGEQGGIVKAEGAMYASKVMPICPKCGKAVRVGHVEKDGKMVRVCKKCGAEL